jgi:hypothetical protein
MSVAACNESLDSLRPSQTWGFINVHASKASDGQHYTAPDAFFFRGLLNSIPNALLQPDSCYETARSTGNQISNVTYLDAGTPLTARIGTRTEELPRTNGQEGIRYEWPVGSPIPYVPGDSLVVTVPGAVGGFPSSEIRAKTADEFTVGPLTLPTGTNDIQLTWSAASDYNSAAVVMIWALPFSSEGSTSINRQLTCAFADDGSASIPFRWYATWQERGGDLADAIATRLRTSYLSIGDALLGVISTYEVPTPEP